MRYLLLLIFAATGAVAQEKVADTREYSIPQSVLADTTAGNLDGSQTYDRVFSDGSNGGSCDYSGIDSGNDGVAYQAFNFYSPSGQVADMEVVLGTLGDSVLFIYCGFDPANPNTNLVAIDDDGGAGFGSAFTPADAIQLQPNVVYTAVVAGFSNTDLGTFDFNLGGDLVFGQPVPAQVPTLSFWALAVLALLVMFGMRRKFVK